MTDRDPLHLLAEARQALNDAVAAARTGGVAWGPIGVRIRINAGGAARAYGRLPAGELVAPAVQKRLLGEVERADRRLDATVAACRQAGRPWREIAHVLGMKQPNAVVKYRPRLKVETTVQVAEHS